MVLVREVPGAVVKAVGLRAVSSFLVAFIPLLVPLRSQCGGGRHLGDSSSAQRVWCEHLPSAEYKQVLLAR